jgi:hypothetical protein
MPALQNNNFTSLLGRSVARSGLSYDGFVRHITKGALGSLKIWSESDLERLLLTCERLGLDPLGREVYCTEAQDAAADAGAQRKPPLVVVALDGWCRIINSHPQFDGMSFKESAEREDGLPLWIECSMHRKDRRVATTVREYMCENRADQSAWLTHPRRMLRHKAMVQCARLSFSLPTLQSIVDHDDLLKMQNLKPPAKDQLSSQEVKHTVSACQETLTEPRPNSRPLSASEYQGVDESHSFNCEDSNAVLYAQKSRKESRASWATPRGPSSRQALIERLEGGLYHL